jgi:Transcriptional regulators
MKDNINSVSTWISVLFRFRRNFILKKLENYGVLAGLYMIVMVIDYNNGTSQEQISDILKTDKTSIARSVKKLEKEGYVLREPDKVDRRAYKLYLTSKGQAIVPVIQKVLDDWEDLVIANVPKDAYQIIEHYMKQMAEDAWKLYISYSQTD